MNSSVPFAADQFSLGLEICAHTPHPLLSESRFGLLMNQASVDRRLRFACDVLSKAYPNRLAALFSPQHGFWGEQQANMIESRHGRHPLLDIPVFSLYSETRKPTGDMLTGLDCLVIDLQDVGTRIYTFIWTVTHCLEACAEAGIPVVILDRPNPLGGLTIEGPILKEEFRSFVGRAAIPMRHALTIAELASYLNVGMGIGAEVLVVPMQNWKRELHFEQLSRAWLPPSPNLPTMQSVRVYPGQVLLEGTNLSEGRGTTTPFELIGAAFIDPFGLCDALTACNLPGVIFRPQRFLPVNDKWSGETCGGVSLHVDRPDRFQSYRTSLQILSAVKEMYVDDFEWLSPPYEYEVDRMPIDILSGSSALRECLDSDGRLSGEVLEALAFSDAESWRDKTDHVLRYTSSSQTDQI